MSKGSSQEKIQATIPSSNKWHTEDIEAKAAALDMDKGAFILSAVDILLNFDTDFYKRICDEAAGLNIPVWLFVQNKLIKGIAQEAAEVEAGTWTRKVLSEFMFISEGGKNRVITGAELFETLKAQYLSKEGK